MKRIIFLITAICIAVISCTKPKADYTSEIDTSVTETGDFKEASSISSNGYKISVEALSGTFYKGYNEIRLKITDAQTKQPVNASGVRFLPIVTGSDDSKASCPHRYELAYKSVEKYFLGYVVFTNESTSGKSWELYLSFTINNQTYQVKQHISVQPQSNKNLNMTAFTGIDDEQYVIALISPQKPKVAENKLVAGIYKYNKPSGPPAGSFPDPTQFSYTEVSNYKLLLDPRMPGPSMGNHSSPNNKDLTQQGDGLYHGVVNYTMTGNWTLNFIMLNHSGNIIKGTEVPKDFTPGKEGVKSELHIDILF